MTLGTVYKARGSTSKTVTAGITAAVTTVGQGAGPLTSDINEVSVVASTDDVVTMPTAVAGREITIINNGANTLLIFPALGDNLGAGVNVGRQLESSESVELVAVDSTNWHVEATTQTSHAEMFDTENTDAFVINAQTDDHMYHTNGMAAGDLAGWTFDAGGAGTSIAIDSIADGADTTQDTIAVTCGTVHGLSVGDIVSISNISITNVDYSDAFVVTAVISTTVFEVAVTFTATATGRMDQAATLICTAGSEGQYLVIWSASATVASNNDIFVFALHVEEAHQSSTNIERKFGIAADIGAMSGSSIINVGSGEHVSFMVRNTVGSGNITLKDLAVTLVRL